MSGVDLTRPSLDSLSEAFQRLCELCPTVPLLSIPWLHLKHPIHPVQAELIRSPLGDRSDPLQGRHSGRCSAWGVRLQRVARLLTAAGYALYLACRIAQMRWAHRAALRSLSGEKFHLIAKSWRFESHGGRGEGSSAEKQDFYYGDLQERLGRRGIRMLVLYGYPRGRPWQERSTSPSPAGRQLPELCLVHPLAPFHAVWEQWRTSVRLGAVARREQGLVRWAAERASLDCLSLHNLPMNLYEGIARRAISLWAPRAFLTLYEGHGWERLIRAGVKWANPRCRTIGYQHTVLFRHQLSLLRPSNGSSTDVRPEIVLCLGPRTAQMLAPAHPDSRLIAFGTFRRAAHPERIPSPAPERRTVLVLPEGHAEEMELLFKTALKAARLLPDHRFVLRCHPMFPSPREQIFSCADEDPDTLPNVEVSEGREIEEDFSRSSVLLYRGSSSVLSAIRCGLKPVYLRDSVLPEVDPLFELRAWREEAGSAEQLAEILRRFATVDPAGLDWGEWAVASAFVQSYAIPVDDSSLDRLLEAIA